MMGGIAAFQLASYSYMVDITTPSTRTRRLAILDSFVSIGGLIGLQLGTFLKKKFGFITVFSIGASLIVVSLLYLVFFVKEKKREKEERSCAEEKVEDLTIRLDGGEVLVVLSDGEVTVEQSAGGQCGRWAVLG